MVKNRIRELRLRHGMSMEKLAEEIGAGTSTVNRLEKGETDLVSEWLPALARALGVTEQEVLGWNQPSNGLSEDAARFDATSGHPLAGASFGPSRDLWVVKSAALDAIGIAPGDVIIVDISSKAVGDVKMGDAVVVQLVDRADPMNQKLATTLLRQYIEPDLFITNSRTGNLPPLNRREHDVRVKGLIVNRFAEVKTSTR